MNRTEHLNAIVARCRELLAMAKKRTLGEWYQEEGIPTEVWGENERFVTGAREDDAAFIASCAGNAERGWETTIGEIEAILPHLTDSPVGSAFTQWHTLSVFCNERADAICRAWPVELLGVCHDN